MKKSLVTALTTALVVGAASTTFAAASPFSDVTPDHWAYTAVTELANKGIVDGYPGGYFDGERSITRYEMAQMVYNLMNKTGLSAADSATVGRLAAEYADELQKMGAKVSMTAARVDTLEKRVNAMDKRIGNFTMKGQIRYDYIRKNSHSGFDGSGASRSQRAQRIIFRLTPDFQINDKWSGHARIDFSLSANSGMNNSLGEKSGAYGENYRVMDQLFAKATYGKTKITVGRLGTYDQATHGMIMDDNVTGIEVAAPISKNFSFQATAGRYSYDPNRTVAADGTPGITTNPTDAYATYKDTCDYMALDVLYKNKKLGLGLGIKNFKGYDIWHHQETYSGGGAHGNRETEWGYNDGTAHYFSGDTMRVWGFGVDYRFNKNWQIVGDYARQIKGGDNFDTAHKTAYSIQLNYKGIDVKKAGSYRLYLAYRQLAKATTMVPTYQNSLYSWQKGWDFGTQFVPAKNVRASMCYFWGKNYGNNTNQSRLFGRLELMF